MDIANRTAVIDTVNVAAAAIGAPDFVINSAGIGSRNSTGAPTGTQRLNYRIASEEFTVEQPRLRAFLEDLRKLRAQLDAAGVPYTTGRYQY
jgi:hypothetical protein